MNIAIPIVAAGVVIVMLMVAAIYARFYVKVPPDQVAIFTGKGGFRIVRGGASIRRPVVERVDFMSLAPFESKLSIHAAYSSEGVPVNVEAVTLIRFDSEEGQIKTAAERFLKADPEQLQATIENVMLGHIRSVLSGMTVEVINSDRTALIQKVTQEASPDLQKMGLSLEVFTIQHIDDDQNYLANMGRRRVAEILRDAEIGEAEAQRDARIGSSKAKQEGETAAAEAEAVIAEAQKDRDVRIAKASAETQREQATAAQAGPLAEAEAKKAVVTAEVAVDAEKVRASIALEEQEIERREKALQHEVIKPAEAERDAAVIKAEGVKNAAVKTAEGTSEALKLTAAAESEAATQRGQGEANARTAASVALQKELEAQGAGTRAQLEGEAAGKLKLAEALEKYNAAGIQLTIGPKLIETLPAILGALAAPMGQIDNIVMIDSGGGDGTNSPMAKWGNQLPMMLGNGITILKALGFDLAGMIGADVDHSNGHHKPEVPADSPELEEVANRVAAASGGSQKEED